MVVAHGVCATPVVSEWPVVDNFEAQAVVDQTTTSTPRRRLSARAWICSAATVGWGSTTPSMRPGRRCGCAPVMRTPNARPRAPLGATPSSSQRATTTASAARAGARLVGLTDAQRAGGAAELVHPRMRPKIPALTEALTGRFGEHHRFMTRLFLDRIDAHNADIARLDARIEAAMEPFRSTRELLMSIPGISRIVDQGARTQATRITRL